MLVMAKPRDIDYEGLHARYVQGKSGMEVAASVGIGWSGLYRAWKRLGLPRRAMSDAKRLQYVQHPEQRTIHPAKMQASRRGGTNSPESQVQRAQTRQRLGLGTSDLEDGVAHRLSDLGESYIRQFAIGPYNVDFALPERNIVVEVDGGAHNRKVRAKRAEREAFIEAAGWRIVRIRRTLARHIRSGGLDDWSPI